MTPSSKDGISCSAKKGGAAPKYVVCGSHCPQDYALAIRSLVAFYTHSLDASQQSSEGLANFQVQARSNYGVDEYLVCLPTDAQLTNIYLSGNPDAQSGSGKWVPFAISDGNCLSQYEMEKTHLYSRCSGIASCFPNSRTSSLKSSRKGSCRYRSQHCSYEAKIEIAGQSSNSIPNTENVLRASRTY